MRVIVDPNADASGFGHADAGRYTLRIVKITEEKKNFPYLKLEAEFSDPNVKATDGKSKVGHVFENMTLKTENNAQFRLRQFSDALGLTWGDFDTDDVIGMEFEAALNVDLFNPENPTNKIAKFFPKGK